MGETIADLILRSFFTINMLPIVLLFSAGLKKRDRFPYRLAGGIIFCLFCASLFTHGFLTYIVEFCAMTVFCFFLYDITVKESVYCLACAYITQHISYGLYQILFRPDGNQPVYSIGYILVSIAVLAAVYYLVVRKLPENGRFNIDLKFSMFSLCIILLLVLVLSIVADNIYAGDRSSMYYVCMAYDLICCVFVLWEQVDYKKKLKKQREQDIEKQIWMKQKELYKLRKDDMETINMICHDLKKHLESLKLFANEEERQTYFNEVSKTIQSYDSQLETGSKVLDILLSQKNLICMKNGIDLTCVADGKKMDFIHAVDLYTILGNAIDNAIESVLMVSDPEKKIISVSVWTKGKLLLMQVENYFENEDLIFENGLPLTTKKESEGHGFGLKSIRNSVEKYDGCMDVGIQNNTFRLMIVVPIP